MAHILFIGYGNTLRRDDGFGCRLGQLLQDDQLDCDIQVLTCHQLTPDLAEHLRGADYIIFADTCAETMPCELMLDKLHIADTNNPDWTHQLDPQALLEIARVLYGIVPCAAFLLKAQAHDWGYGQELSPEMQHTLERAHRRVLKLCAFLCPASAAHMPQPLVMQYA